MRISIIGLGYVGSYLSKRWLTAQSDVVLYSRQQHTHNTACRVLDLDHEFNPSVTLDGGDLLYYLVPPAEQETHHDPRVYRLLQYLSTPPRHIVYFSTSGVYGDCLGAWIDETHPPQPQFPRHYRRLDAEQQLTQYCQTHDIALSILRVAGIYGPNRLPLQAVMQRQAIIHPEQAPITNHIHITDLVEIAYQMHAHTHGIAIYNIADGDPQAMGTLHRLLARALHLAPLPTISLAQALAEASPMRREFMLASKRLRPEKWQRTLTITAQYPTLEQGIRAILANTAVST